MSDGGLQVGDGCSQVTLFRKKESPPVIRVCVVRFETYGFVIFVPRTLNVAAMGKRNRQIDAREIVMRSEPDRFAES